MPSALFARIQSELNAARKAQDKPRTLLLSTLLSDAKNREIELGREITDDDVVDVVRRGIKRRRESVEMYEKGGRGELAASERAEVSMLEGFLPAGVSDDELRAAIRTAIAGGAANIGAVMGAVMKQYKGRAEGGTINRIAREELAKG
ncbi:MAG TPA: GatB/YqeY domain-containing protein [Gemmatimonadaceae bacterium]|nr:GatB/YqeY domain-containing protein [Gemmatimonadaceae bacterium]